MQPIKRVSTSLNRLRPLLRTSRSHSWISAGSNHARGIVRMLASNQGKGRWLLAPAAASALAILVATGYHQRDLEAQGAQQASSSTETKYRVSEKTLAIVKATAPAVAARSEDITKHFYRLMFAGNPEVKAYFNPAHQHSGQQPRALANAIVAYATHIDNLAAVAPALRLIAEKHVALGIQPEHYPIVGKHLLIAVKDILGEAITDEVIDAWAEAYQVLAQALIDEEAHLYRIQADQPGGWNGYRQFRVCRKVSESDQVMSFYLKPVDDGQLPMFHPGQFITVRVNDRKNGGTTLRNYSLSDRPGLDSFRISVKREADPHTPAGVVSNLLHDEIHAGDVLEIGPPSGNFTVNPTPRRPVVFLGAGIGATPLVSMFRSLASSGVATPVYFFQNARNGRQHALAEEIRRTAAERSNFQAHFCYTSPSKDDLQNAVCDSTGRINVELLSKMLPNNDADFYICGPSSFIVKLRQELKAWGVPESQIHFEFFGPSLSDLSV